MNPDTKTFEPETEQTHKEWKRFAVGEVLTIKGLRFVIESIEPKRLNLRPAGPLEGVDPAETYTQRLQRQIREKSKG